jgi:hypothetical protein
MILLIVRIFAVLLVSVAASAPQPPWSGLPMRTKTAHGIPGDPVNVGIEGSRAAILAAFKAIGWLQADKLSLRNDLKMAEAAVLRRPYPTAPVSRLYLFNRMQDFSVEHPLGNTIARRDHARFWDTGRVDPSTHLELWIGDASRDTGVEVLFRFHIPVGTTHHIDPNVDAERNLIAQEIKHAGLEMAVVTEPGIGPTTNGHNAGGDRFYTDGKVDVIVLNAA